MYARTYVRTDVRTFETGFIRSTLSKSGPKMISIILPLLLMFNIWPDIRNTEVSVCLHDCGIRTVQGTSVAGRRWKV